MNFNFYSGGGSAIIVQRKEQLFNYFMLMTDILKQKEFNADCPYAKLKT